LEVNYLKDVKASLKLIEAAARSLSTSDEMDYEQSALLVLAGLGGVRLEDNNGGAPIWASMPDLKDIESAILRELKLLRDRACDDSVAIGRPFDSIVEPILRSFDEDARFGIRRTKASAIVEIGMSPSLKLAIAEIVDHCLLSDEEADRRITPALALLILAGKGQAELELVDKGVVWLPGVELLLNFKSVTAEGGFRSQGGGALVLGGAKVKHGVVKSKYRNKLRMDALLKDLTKYCYKASRKTVPGIGRDAASIIVLIGAEAHGDAIAYKDADGHLAWKASDKFVREYREYCED
jgi:hypothetical protein